MRIKVIGDGTKFGTRIINAETGEDIEYVTQATITLGPDQVPKIILHTYKIELDIEGELQEEVREIIHMKRRASKDAEER